MQCLTGLVKILPAVKLRQIKPFAENAAAVVFMVGAHVNSQCGGRSAHKKSSIVDVV
jgi:hemolysin-activating ACP:hemolysin acyltransferase